MNYSIKSSKTELIMVGMHNQLHLTVAQNNKLNVIDPQLSTPLTFSQCGTSDMSSESEDSGQKSRAKILHEEPFSIIG